MSTAADLHSQIASIMEVLANAAVAEICRAVEDGYAVVRLEASRSQKENDFLRRKMRLLELQVARYRAERTREAGGGGGGGGSRFPGVRLLPRHSRNSPPAPSLQSRTRFLNRFPEAQHSVPKAQTVKLDQDPDQDVVTTTKTESAEEEEAELLIVKVEGATETTPTLLEAPCTRAGAAAATSIPRSPGRPAGRRSGLEVSGSDAAMTPATNRSSDSGHSSQHGPTASLVSAAAAPLCGHVTGSRNGATDKPPGSEVIVIDGGETAEGPTGAPRPLATGSPFPRPLLAGSPSPRRAAAAERLSQGWGLRRPAARGGGEKPFGCPLCGKAFACRSQLDVHGHVHTGERPFCCGVCGRRFSHPSNLRRHQKVQHPGQGGSGGARGAGQQTALPPTPGRTGNGTGTGNLQPERCRQEAVHSALTVLEPQTQTQTPQTRNPPRPGTPPGPKPPQTWNPPRPGPPSDLEPPSPGGGATSPGGGAGSRNSSTWRGAAEEAQLLLRVEPPWTGPGEDLDRMDGAGGRVRGREGWTSPLSLLVPGQRGPWGLARCCRSTNQDSLNPPCGLTPAAGLLQFRSCSGTAAEDSAGVPDQAEQKNVGAGRKTLQSATGPSRLDQRTGQNQGDPRQPPCSTVSTAPGFGSEGPRQRGPVGAGSPRPVDGAAPGLRPPPGEPPGDAEFEAVVQYGGFSVLPVAVGTAASRHQRREPSGHGAGQDEPPPPPLPHACTFCSRRYAHQCQLRIHERAHAGEKPHRCAQCGKSFGQLCSLKRHLVVHTGERPFPCPHCGKQFSTAANRKVHQSVHTGERSFHCAKCGKNFSFLSNLIRHQALHAR
ncbi:zinc finger protein 467-like [Salarias fasciatus]|uniref:zinc finger protein 467-like n=1 Tax=Salarias fasciatus TaxID=181472 RepID=UPI001176D9A7|nr:zinc finger protein 467-like [Salarias fasciatus]